MLGTLDKIHLHSMTPCDFESVLRILASVRPDEVYNLASQSAVGLSFQNPVETIGSIAVGSLHLLEAIRCLGRPIRIFSAGSVECFGDSEEMITEDHSVKPVNPYAVAKAAALWEVASYRQSYGLFACTGIMSNHESPLRSECFVTQKVVSAVCQIARGGSETLFVGNLDIMRDWGWAEEYVNAMWLMLQQQLPRDYVLGTGRSYTLRELIEHTFRLFGLDWRPHTQVRSELIRAGDSLRIRVDPSKARKELGWRAQITMPDVIRRMVTEAWRKARNQRCGCRIIPPRGDVLATAQTRRLGRRTPSAHRVKTNGFEQVTKRAPT